MEKIHSGEQPSRSIIVTTLECDVISDFIKRSGMELPPFGDRGQLDSQNGAEAMVRRFVEFAHLEGYSTFVDPSGKFYSFVTLPCDRLDQVGLEPSIVDGKDPIVLFGHFELSGFRLDKTDTGDMISFQVLEGSDDFAAFHHRLGWRLGVDSKTIER